MHPAPPPWLQLGPVGRPRPTGRCFAIGVLSLGIGLYVWSYRVHREMKAHTGQGIGGGIAILLMLLVSLAMPFITSGEVGALHARRGLPEPVRTTTGLWVLVPALLGYPVAAVAVLGVLVAAEDAPGWVVAVAAAAAYLLVLLAGGWVWFRRTNEALNRYWQHGA